MMLRKLFSRLSYANVISTLCLFVVLGSGAYAVATAPKDSVVSRSIKNGQVKKKDLGVPAKYKDVGFTDQFGSCPGGVNEWRDATFFNGPVGYYRDPFGIVHLRGTVIRCGTVSDVIFTLPAGYRPNGNALDTLGVKNQTDAHEVRILSNGEVSATTPGIATGNTLSFEGITFRCAPSGQDGCP
jgi:hypothetical protein